MATANQIKALLKSHVNGDDEKFITIAMQVAAHEAKHGHTKLAQELKQLINEAKTRKTKHSNVLSIVRTSKELDGILSLTEPLIDMNDLTFADNQSKTFKRIIQEYKQQEKLKSYNLEPRRKILLYGPPGEVDLPPIIQSSF